MKNIGYYDLHMHLDGSLDFELVRKLARMQSMKELPDESLCSVMVVPKNCKNLNEYLRCFEYPLTLLQTETAIEMAVYHLLERYLKDGCVYVEIRFAPQLHQRKGLSQEQVITAALRGQEKFFETYKGRNFNSGLILCCMRGNDNGHENMETVELAKEYLNHGVVALDLAGAEGLFPTKGFKELFKKASDAGIPFTIHAGEADGPESIWEAIEFGAKRIGHGVRAVEDPVLMKRLFKDHIVLELCPTSNMDTKIYKDITNYPIMKFLEECIKITINTDNTTVSNTSIEKEFHKIQSTFNLSKEEMMIFLENSRYGAFGLK